MCPDRYHLVGHNYDLCQAEYEKLPEKKKALFRKIPPRGARDGDRSGGRHRAARGAFARRRRSRQGERSRRLGESVELQRCQYGGNRSGEHRRIARGAHA
jgi:hypothetical protein